MTQFTTFVGIDVSKATLDVYIHPEGMQSCFANTPAGHKSLTQTLRRHAKTGPVAVAFEASGGYERMLGAALSVPVLVKAGITAFQLDASQARSFARAERQRAKTDRIDAAMIARAVMALHESMTPYRHDKDAEKLVEHLRLRDIHVDQIVQFKTSLENIQDAALRRIISSQIRTLQKSIVLVETLIRSLIAADPARAARDRQMQSVPGIGPIVSATLIGRLPELGSLSSREVAAMVGVAPYDNRSGKRTGAKRCSGGRPAVRRVLYLAALCVVRMKAGALRAVYDRLMANGKPFKVALNAVMRKMVVALNAMIAHDTTWHAA